MKPPARWHEIEQVVANALDLPIDERDRYVDSACGQDTSLSTEVRALLRAFEDAGGFLEPNTCQEKWSAVETEAGSFEGKLAGPYRLVRLLGRGGMGVVYLGRRDDEQFEKEVAVKLINPALYSPSVMRRFRDERQILAGLEHPNIARLLDAGMTAEGVPFIVMEYVAGEPIHRHCERRRLSIDERLALFLNVCDAVGCAHRNLVVHRDLKPSNILVTADGVPKLLDFGIATTLDHAPQATAPLTAAMTPEYASPEQLRGGNLTTASDVYSLGVLLYELLAGKRPYDLAGKPLDEVLDAVCVREPPRLPAAMGDLSYIVAKTIRKEPAERYGSVEQLAADIERYRRGLPVEARRGTLRYKTGKYLRRYRVAVAVGVAAALLAVAGVAAIVAQARIAERRFNQVRQLARSMIFELNDGLATLPGAIPVRKQLVTQALEYLNRLAAESHGDRSLTLELAGGYKRVGEMQGGVSTGNLGDPAGAIASFEKARDLLSPLYAANPHDRETAILLSTVYYSLMGVYAGRRDFSKSSENGAGSERILDAVLRERPGDEEATIYLANTYFGHAAVLGYSGGDRLSAYWTKCLSLYKSLLDAGSRNKLLPKNYARALTNYGSNLLDAGRLEEALAVFRQSHAINEKRLAAAPNNSEAAVDLTLSYHGMGTILNRLGRAGESLELLRKSLSLTAEWSAASPQDIDLLERLGQRHLGVGEQLLRMNRDAEALAEFRETIRIGQNLAARTPPVVFAKSPSQRAYLSAGEVQRRGGDLASACQSFKQSMRLYGEMSKPGKAETETQAKAVAAAASCR